MGSIPQSIIRYVLEHIRYPSAVIGCHAVKNDISYECCEYDIAIFDHTRAVKCEEHIKINGYAAKFIFFTKTEMYSQPYISDMILLKDYDDMIHSSIRSWIQSNRYSRRIQLHGKRCIIDSIFYVDKINTNLTVFPIASATWLKVAAYNYLEAILAIHEIASSPLHELSQLRDVTKQHEDIITGINIALECIGVERASRSSISRSLRSITSIINDEVIESEINAKVNYLLAHNMLPDCYHYLGKIGLKYLPQETQFAPSLKTIQMLDLNIDPLQIQKLSNLLLKACRDALRINVR